MIRNDICRLNHFWGTVRGCQVHSRCCAAVPPSVPRTCSSPQIGLCPVTHGPSPPPALLPTPPAPCVCGSHDCRASCEWTFRACPSVTGSPRRARCPLGPCALWPVLGPPRFLSGVKQCSKADLGDGCTKPTELNTPKRGDRTARELQRVRPGCPPSVLSREGLSFRN